uniref:hypothetical protein n=1 Tax=Gluconobacter thailandicus TaxID=257438 RepID=UPI000A52FDDF|nr:hypothetical protein [Gluconobacter thailandicus]
MINEVRNSLEIVSLYAREAAAKNEASMRECNEAVRRLRAFIEQTLKTKEVTA